MKNMDTQAKDMHSMSSNSEIDILKKSTDRFKGILDAKYVPADLQQVTEDCSYLKKENKFN